MDNEARKPVSENAILPPWAGISLFALALGVILSFAFYFLRHNFGFFEDRRGWPGGDNSPQSFSWRFGFVEADGDLDGDGMNDVLVAAGKTFASDPNHNTSTVAAFSGASGTLMWSKRNPRLALGAGGVAFLGNQSRDGAASIVVGSMRQSDTWTPRVTLHTSLWSASDGKELWSREDRRNSFDDDWEVVRPLVAVLPASEQHAEPLLITADVRDKSRSYFYNAVAVRDPANGEVLRWIASPHLESSYASSGIESGSEEFKLIDVLGKLLSVDHQVAEVIPIPSDQLEYRTLHRFRNRWPDPNRPRGGATAWFAVGDLDRNGLPELVSTAFTVAPGGGQGAWDDGLGVAKLWELSGEGVVFKNELVNWTGLGNGPRFCLAVPHPNSDEQLALALGYLRAITLVSSRSGHELDTIETTGDMRFYGAKLIEEFGPDRIGGLAVVASSGDRHSLLLYSLSPFRGQPVVELPLPLD